MDYIVVDIETCPIDKNGYLSVGVSERKKLLNPIDSKIIAIGIKRRGNDPIVFHSKDEKQMLGDFWLELSAFRKGDFSNKIVGFNIKGFDLPFLVTRSFMHEVTIAPFVLKDVIDLRESLSAFKYGKLRGKLKDFAQYIKNLEVLDDIDGEKVAEEYWAGNIDKILEYLKKDLEITEAIYNRVVKLRINEIQRW